MKKLFCIIACILFTTHAFSMDKSPIYLSLLHKPNPQPGTLPTHLSLLFKPDLRIEEAIINAPSEIKERVCNQARIELLQKITTAPENIARFIHPRTLDFINFTIKESCPNQDAIDEFYTKNNVLINSWINYSYFLWETTLSRSVSKENFELAQACLAKLCEDIKKYPCMNITYTRNLTNVLSTRLEEYKQLKKAADILSSLKEEQQRKEFITLDS